MRNKKVFRKIFLLFTCLAMLPFLSFAQKKEILVSADSSNTVTATIDSTASGKKIKKVNVYSPRKAAIRSAILPGWGQIGRASCRERV